MPIARIFIIWILSSLLAFPAGAKEYSLRHYDDSDGLSHWHVSSVLQDSTDMIWVATWNGLNRFDGSRFVTFKAEDGDGVLMPSDRIRKIVLREDGNLLCLIEDRVILFDTKTCRFDTLPTEEEAYLGSYMRAPQKSSYDISPIRIYSQALGQQTLSGLRSEYVDKQGNRWLIDEHGVYVATPVNEIGEYCNRLRGRYVRRMANGDFWFCERDTRRVLVYDSVLSLRGYLGTDMRVHKESCTFAPVYSVCEREDGHTLIGCKPGDVIDISGSTRRTLDNTPNVYDMVTDTMGRTWMASFAHGVLWTQNGFVRPITAPMFARRLLLMPDGKLLAATTDGLLLIDDIYARTLSMRLYERDGKNKQSLSSNAVMCLCYHDSMLFVGTEGGGINVVRDFTNHAGDLSFQHLGTLDGLGSDNVFEFLPWNDSTLLVQGNSWLALLNTRTLEVTNYGHSFFHRTVVFGEVPPIRLNDGQLLLALSDGLLVQNPELLRYEDAPIRIALTEIQHGNQRSDYAVDGLDEIRLGKNERSVAIRFSALDFRNDRHIYYSTRIYRDGDRASAWSTPTETNEVILQDLRPGKYRFEIVSTNAYGHRQSNVRTLVLTVTPTFLESTIGQLLVALLVLIVIVLITWYTVHIRALRLKQQETLHAYLELQEQLASYTSAERVMTPGIAGKDEHFIQQLRQYVETNMDRSEVGIDDMALALAMSRSSLSRKTRELFNLSPSDFLREARLRHACELLRTTEMQTKEVAYSCGFSDPKYFAKCFKSSTGLTPTEYKQKNQSIKYTN